MTGKAIGLRLNQGYAGEPSRTNPVPDIFTRPAGEALEFGIPLAVNEAGEYVKFTKDNAIDQFAGICTRGVQQALEYLTQTTESGYAKDSPAACFKRGYVIINVKDGETKPFGKVYLDKETNKFTAIAENNIELPSLRFTTGKKDANNNAEIEIGYLPMSVVPVSA